MPRMKHVLTALTAAGAIGLTAACGSSWSASDIESDLARDLDNEFPQDAPHEVDCQEGLDAEVGESTSCEVEDANGAGTIVVEIVQVDGNEIEYEAEFSDYNLHNGENDLDSEGEADGEDEG